MSELYAAAIGAIVGAVLGGGVSFVAQTVASARVGRAERTVRLYEEWHSASMLSARITANAVLRANLDAAQPLSFTQLSEDMLATDRAAEWHAVSRVVHYFELVAKLDEERSLDRPLFWRLFGRYVGYWRSRTMDSFLAISERVDHPDESGWSTAIRNLTPSRQ